MYCFATSPSHIAFPPVWPSTFAAWTPMSGRRLLQQVKRNRFCLTFPQLHLFIIFHLCNRSNELLVFHPPGGSLFRTATSVRTSGFATSQRKYYFLTLLHVLHSHQQNHFILTVFVDLLGAPFSYLLAPFGSLVPPLGSLLAPVGALLVSFGSRLVAAGSPLVHFGV